MINFRIVQNIILLKIIFLFLNSCGFQVIYDHKKADSCINELASIKIQKIRDRKSQELKNSLYDALNPQKVKAESSYILAYNISKTLAPTYITETGSSGRYRININIDYKLKRISDKKIISSGYVNVNDNYDVSSNRYATHTAENYVVSNLLDLGAKEIRNSIVNDLTSYCIKNNSL